MVFKTIQIENIVLKAQQYCDLKVEAKKTLT